MALSPSAQVTDLPETQTLICSKTRDERPYDPHTAVSLNVPLSHRWMRNPGLDVSRQSRSDAVSVIRSIVNITCSGGGDGDGRATSRSG